ncbi:MAG TPA: molybdenum ABC transporter ATP-binding protein [Ramlibacter sp.]|uniref:molybdenum ABC transporter ATP-binding protein n=1 Tax=Ramlibacter sp. TaxID=1917967 RepID=UPI002D80989C|nr:molybdenum ABC transporter ATP-binding protein [Ramlibacter sp.]HET8747783.1 molybdenum ABC transporter ATP-binding protein [Ramlibacter sp.]
MTAPIFIRAELARPGFTLDMDLELPPRGITAVFGPSGCGKTTLLRCVAGLERPRAARISVQGQVWQDSIEGVFLPPWRRPLGYVFQEASLFDHLDVRGNLEFALQRRKGGENGNGRDRGFELPALLSMLDIGHLLARRPHQLSGGERQRVAIARALATRPRLLLLDEPLAAVDVARRREILPWLERLRDELHVPMLYVTHAADEVARLASYLVLMESGRCLAAGPLAETLARVDLPLLAGDEAAALLEGEVEEIDARWHLAHVVFPGGSLWVADSGLIAGRAVRVRVLARDVSVVREPPHGSSIQNVLPCQVRAIAPAGHPSQVTVQLACGSTLLLARVTARAVHQLKLAVGDPVWAQVKSAALVG